MPFLFKNRKPRHEFWNTSRTNHPTKNIVQFDAKLYFSFSLLLLSSQHIRIKFASTFSCSSHLFKLIFGFHLCFSKLYTYFKWNNITQFQPSNQLINSFKTFDALNKLKFSPCKLISLFLSEQTLCQQHGAIKMTYVQFDRRTKWSRIKLTSWIMIDYGLFRMIYKPSKLIYSSVHIDRVYHFIRKFFIPLYT